MRRARPNFNTELEGDARSSQRIPSISAASAARLISVLKFGKPARASLAVGGANPTDAGMNVRDARTDLLAGGADPTDAGTNLRDARTDLAAGATGFVAGHESPTDARTDLAAGAAGFTAGHESPTDAPTSRGLSASATLSSEPPAPRWHSD